MSHVCRDGERFALLAPFAGLTRLEREAVGDREYSFALGAYYLAVAALGGSTCGGASGCSGNAGAVSGEYVCGVARRVAATGGFFGEGGVGSRSEASSCDDTSGSVAELGRDGTCKFAEGTCRNDRVTLDADVVSVSGRDGDIPVVRGKHYFRNQRKRQNRAGRKATEGSERWRHADNWRRVDGSGGCVSDASVTGTARTVDTRTAVEFEAAQTLAARRVVENKLAIAKSNAQLVGFSDKAKTDAVARLSVARMEQRINEAKAKSQASYKQCDESLKSLGSTGSAGEFALKQQIKDAKQDRIMLKHVEAQAAVFAAHASPECLAQVAAMPPPVFENEHDVFGECPDDYNEDEQFAYYRDLDRRQLEQDEACLSFSPF